MLHRACQSPHRSSLLPVGVRLPREHKAIITVVRSLASGRFHPVGPVIDHASGNALIHQEHGRIHPQLRVPEYMSVISQRRQTHRRNTASCSLTTRRIEVIQGKTDSLLSGKVPFDLNIRLPEPVPQPSVTCYDLVVSVAIYIYKQPLSLAERVGILRGGADRADDGKFHFFTSSKVKFQHCPFSRHIIDTFGRVANEH